jgi:hypothetical protein
MAAETNDTDIMGTILFKPYQDLGSSGDRPSDSITGDWFPDNSK